MPSARTSVLTSRRLYRNYKIDVDAKKDSIGSLTGMDSTFASHQSADDNENDEEDHQCSDQTNEPR